MFKRKQMGEVGKVKGKAKVKDKLKSTLGLNAKHLMKVKINVSCASKQLNNSTPKP